MLDVVVHPQKYPRLETESYCHPVYQLCSSDFQLSLNHLLGVYYRASVVLAECASLGPEQSFLDPQGEAEYYTSTFPHLALSPSS